MTDISSPSAAGATWASSAGEQDDEELFSRHLERRPESAGAARRLVSSAFRSWGLESAEDEGRLIVSELVGNAVEHARYSRILVIVTRVQPDLVKISVVDRSGALPEPHEAGPWEESGRGLSIVDALCGGRWGVDQLGWGKCVWVLLETGGADR
ncbi:ATP-binding protein [Streptomyces sp. NPDC048717]|uniref:ATP-binding protein n=1 Tax=Streptomyces sp. NPDC048717 TaxID=3154928 RepID=UPI00343C83F2